MTDKSSQLTAGMALLFSAGTFLFVSTHVMADIDATSNVSSHDGESPTETPSSKRSRIVYFVLGMMTPLLLSMLLGHHHGH